MRPERSRPPRFTGLCALPPPTRRPGESGPHPLPQPAPEPGFENRTKRPFSSTGKALASFTEPISLPFPLSGVGPNHAKEPPRLVGAALLPMHRLFLSGIFPLRCTELRLLGEDHVHGGAKIGVGPFDRSHKAYGLPQKDTPDEQRRNQIGNGPHLSPCGPAMPDVHRKDVYKRQAALDSYSAR